MKNENFEICKSIAKELEAIINGEKHVCENCGCIIEGENLTICPECESEDITTSDVYSYFYDKEIFDIKYTINGDMSYDHVRLMIACGGPNIFIDTNTQSIRLAWWNEKAEFPLDLDAVEAIDEYWAEIYNYHK